MSKEEVTRKFLKENYYIINTGNGSLQFLLRYDIVPGLKDGLVMLIFLVIMQF